MTKFLRVFVDFSVQETRIFFDFFMFSTNLNIHIIIFIYYWMDNR